MASILRIFDHFCKPLTEIEAPTTNRGWVLNNFERCDFSIGYDVNDPLTKVTEQNFQFGNLVHIEHVPTKDENGIVHGKLPDWVGIILVPQDWSDGVLHSTAFSAEAILAGRALPWLDKVNGTPRTMFLKILDLANQMATNIPIQPGVVEDMEGFYPDDFRLMALDHIRKLTASAGMDWNVTGMIDNQGNLQLFANLYRRAGVETDLELTTDNTRLGSILLSVQGTPVNELFAFSQANTRQMRVDVNVRNDASIADYGPLQLNKTFQGKHDMASLHLTAQNLVNQRGRPVKTFPGRSVLDVSDTFGKLGVGNICFIKDSRVGFKPGGGFGTEAKVRIKSVSYNDLTNECPVNLEVFDG